VDAQVPSGAFGLTGLRVLLTADILVRVAELRGLQALTNWTFADQSAEQETAAGHAADALNIHPPARPVPADGRADVCVTAGEGNLAAQTLLVAQAQLPGGGGPDGGLDGALAGPDPLAIRLALMDFPFHEPVELSEDMLADAQAALAGWRRQVAQWAESPSRPVPAQSVTAFRVALGQLNAAGVLAVLRRVTTEDDVAPGTKFETFLYADRVLGLDLPARIGHTS
jgi:hypothetical protein